MSKEAAAGSAYPPPERLPTVTYKGSKGWVCGDPKWERRRIVDPEYKDHIEVDEGWYTYVAFVGDENYAGFRYVPLVKLMSLDGTPYPQPAPPSERPPPKLDPYFYTGEKTMPVPTPNAPPGFDFSNLAGFLADKLFDTTDEYRRPVKSAPPTETWRALQPPAVREFAQNRYEGHKFFGNLVVAAITPEGAAVYRNEAGHIWLVATREAGLWAVAIAP